MELKLVCACVRELHPLTEITFRFYTTSPSTPEPFIQIRKHWIIRVYVTAIGYDNKRTHRPSVGGCNHLVTPWVGEWPSVIHSAVNSKAQEIKNESIQCNLRDKLRCFVLSFQKIKSNPSSKNKWNSGAEN